MAVVGGILILALLAAPLLSFLEDRAGEGTMIRSLLELMLAVVPPILAAVALLVVYRIVPLIRPSWRAGPRAGDPRRPRPRRPDRVFTFIAPRLLAGNVVYGAIGTILVGLTWLDFVFIVILFGAAWVVERRALEAARALSGRPDGQPWRVPQRRQNRALADSERPQFEHGWTPAIGADAPATGGATTCWAEAAHSASLGLPDRLARRAMLGESSVPGRTGHCGSPDAWARHGRRHRGLRRRDRLTGRAGGLIGSEDLPGRLLDDVLADGQRERRRGGRAPPERRPRRRLRRRARPGTSAATGSGSRRLRGDGLGDRGLGGEGLGLGDGLGDRRLRGDRLGLGTAPARRDGLWLDDVVDGCRGEGASASRCSSSEGAASASARLAASAPRSVRGERGGRGSGRQGGRLALAPVGLLLLLLIGPRRPRARRRCSDQAGTA